MSREKQFSQKPLPVEFAVGSIYGVRSFGLDKLGRLTGVHFKQIWLPGENVAECRNKTKDRVERTIEGWRDSGLRYESRSPLLSGYSSSSITSTLLKIEREHEEKMSKYASLRYWLRDEAIPPVATIRVPVMREPEVLGYNRVKKGIFASEDQPVYGPETVEYEDRTENIDEDNETLLKWAKSLPDKEQHDFVSCTCGFYGFFDGSDEYSNLETIDLDYNGKSRKNDTYAPVSAVIEAYGETLIGERGFRASKTKIIALRLDPEHLGTMLVRKIKRNYPDAAIFNDMNSMLEVYPPSDELGVTPSNTEDFWTRKA